MALPAAPADGRMRRAQVSIKASFRSSGYGQWSVSRPALLLLQARAPPTASPVSPASLNFGLWADARLSCRQPPRTAPFIEPDGRPVSLAGQSATAGRARRRRLLAG